MGRRVTIEEVVEKRSVKADDRRDGAGAICKAGGRGGESRPMLYQFCETSLMSQRIGLRPSTITRPP